MKLILFLFCILSAYEVFAQGDAPPFTQGQKQTNVDVATKIRVPNNQSTKISTSQSLIETGNRNLLVNPSFEHFTLAQGWTTGGTAVFFSETSAPLSGDRSTRAVMTAQTLQFYQDTTLYASVLAGTQGVIRFSASNTAAGVTACQRAAGVKLTGANNCVTLATDGVKKNYELPVVLSATSNGVEISAASTTGVTILDDFEISDSLSLPEVSQAQIAVDAYIAGTANCTGWTRTSTTLGAFATDADCPGPTIVLNNIGSAQTTDSDLPRFTVNNLPAGQYKATFITAAFLSVSAASSFSIFDGTSNCIEFNSTTDTASGQVTFSCTFNYTSSSNRSFELYARSASSTVNILNDTGTGYSRNLRFILEYYPPASKIYSQRCTSAVDCENVFSAKVSAAGIVSNENLDWINGNCALAATNDFTCTFNASIFTVAPNCTVVVDNGNTGVPYISTLDITSSTIASYRTNTDAAVQSAQAAQIICQKAGVDFKEKSQITGTFREVMTVSNVSKPKTCYYYFGGASATLAAPTECTTGTCVEVYDSCNAVTAPAFNSTGFYTDLTFSNGTWASSSPVDCGCKAYDTTTGTTRECFNLFVTGDNSWSSNASGGYVGNFASYSIAGGSENSYVQVKCEGQGP